MGRGKGAARRVGASLLWGGLAAGSAVAASAPATSDPAIRVLLMESESSVRVRGGASGAGGTTVVAIRDGLAARARYVGPTWRLQGNGSLHVGDWRVRGDLEFHRVPQGVQVVNRVPLEEYVAGTLGREVYPGWSPETLKAQAVATRTYALHQRARHAGRTFDVPGDTAGQVYGGRPAETPAVLAAARATRGEYLAYARKPILAVFHSSSGGRTASAQEVWGEPLPYLVSLSVEDEEDSPDTYWRASVPGTTLERALERLGIRVGRIRDLRVVERSPSDRVRRVRVAGPRGAATLPGRALRSALGAKVIRSTLFQIRPLGDGFVFVGSGHGHGVGMSQWGAEAMAKRGASYREILATFYPGTELLGGLPR